MKRLPLSCDLRHNHIVLQDDQIHYLTRVLRLQVGAELMGFDGHGKQRLFSLSLDPEKKWILQAKGEIEKGETRFPIGLCYGIPKGEKLDLVVRQLTELGVYSLDLFQAKRSVSIWKKDKISSKLKRLNKVIEQAARQSHQTTLLTLSPPLNLHELMLKYQDVKLKLYLDPLASQGWPALAKIEENSSPLHCLLLVGPEGGLDPKEIELLRENNWQGVRLKTPILRTETAAIVACALALDRLGYLD